MVGMSEQPRYGAPSPADGPTTPGTGAVPRAEVTAAASSPSSARPSPPPSRPSSPPSDHPTIPDGAAAASPRGRTSPGRPRAGGGWVGLVLGAVVLAVLLVFVLQNLEPARVAFLGLEATLPLGVSLLLAAIAGMLLVAVTGLGAVRRWRRAVRRDGRMR
jgi:uncharacterized integral membrane protein